jgi:hypothetical protein
MRPSQRTYDSTQKWTYFLKVWFCVQINGLPDLGLLGLQTKVSMSNGTALT